MLPFSREKLRERSKWWGVRGKLMLLLLENLGVENESTQGKLSHSQRKEEAWCLVDRLC